MLRVGLGLICRLMLIFYCHNESLFSNQAEHESLRKGFYTCTHFRSFKYNPFIFIYPKQNYEAALNNSGVSYWPSAKEESCNKLFLPDSDTRRQPLAYENKCKSVTPGIKMTRVQTAETGPATGHISPLYLLYLLWLISILCCKEGDLQAHCLARILRGKQDGVTGQTASLVTGPQPDTGSGEIVLMSSGGGKREMIHSFLFHIIIFS